MFLCISYNNKLTDASSQIIAHAKLICKFVIISMQIVFQIFPRLYITLFQDSMQLFVLGFTQHFFNGSNTL